MSSKRRGLDVAAGFARAVVQAGDVLDASQAVAEREAAASAATGVLAPLVVPLADVHPSPYQPDGRPSASAVAAVRAGIAAAGSLAVLVGWHPRHGAGAPGALSNALDAAAADDAPVGAEVRHAAYRALGAEARALADLAADVLASGITSPLEARPRAAEAGGGWELVSGHRRRVAADLAGLATVPVVSLGPISDAEAASLVFARNRLRADFGTFHEAQALATLQQLRGGSVRTLAASLGYSHGRAGDLLQMARTFTAATRAAIGGGDEEVGTAAVAALSYRQLRDLVAVAADPAALVAAARRSAKLEAAPAPVSNALDTPAVERKPRRGGGFTMTVSVDPAQASKAQARAIVEALTAALREYAGRAGGAGRRGGATGDGARTLQPRRARRGS